MRRLVRVLGLMMIVAGAGALLWAVTVWQWQDPFTAVLNKLEQRELAEGLEQGTERYREQRRLARVVATRSTLASDAASWRRSVGRGEAVGRLRVPRLGLEAVIVNGTDKQSLKRGPGRYLGSAMPGEGQLVYIAGHRTTYGAPFSRIDHMRKGDPVWVELPYATFEYRVTGYRIVPATKTSELRSRGFEQLALQACHPRFFATQRYIVYAKPVRVAAARSEQTVAYQALD